METKPLVNISQLKTKHGHNMFQAVTTQNATCDNQQKLPHKKDWLIITILAKTSN